MTINHSVKTSLLCHERYLSTVLDHLDIYESKIRDNIEFSRSSTRGFSHVWLNEWENLLDTRNSQQMKNICQGLDDHSQSMRQVSPFTGLLPLSS